MKNINKLKKIDYSKVVESGESHSFYRSVAKSVLIYLESNRKATFQEIVKYVGGSDRRTLRLLDQMISLDIIKFRKPFFYTARDKGITIPISTVRCNRCNSMIVDIGSSKETKELLKFMKKVVKGRPILTFIFDQRPVTPETTVRRVAYMIMRGDVQGKKVAILGDDDLTSIALAKTGNAKEVVVFDIDNRLLNYIQKISKAEKLNIKTVSQDLIKRFPEKYINYFDTFLTDPTPTPKPIMLFTSLGIRSLKKGEARVGYVSLYPSHMEKEINFQKALSKMNVLVTDMIPYFGQYDFVKFTYSNSDLNLLKKYASDEQKISFWEYFMRFETTKTTQPIEMKLTALDLLGRATKRVLEDPSKDPVLGKEQKPAFIQERAVQLKKLVEENERN